MLFSKHFKEIVPYPTDYRASRGGYDLLSFLTKAGSLGLVKIAVRGYVGIPFYTPHPLNLPGMTSSIWSTFERAMRSLSTPTETPV